ncbi:MAG: translocation protein TolB [Cyclobacteriaceae bacterium]|nr:translocation protein TolB [Cyclobacteriaceae bacterium]
MAQQTREVFGKNRLQYIDFDWKYYSSVNFDVYYYGKGAKTARKATEHLEEEFERITDIVGYSPYFKAKIFIYNSITEMQQSNVGVNTSSHRVGGQTDFVKTYVEIANPGSTLGLKQELVLGLSELILTDMLFGGSLSDMWQNTYLMSLPDWFVKGAIAYLAKGWDVEMDDRIRDLMSSGSVNKLNKLGPKEGVFAGQSMWNFLVQKYGKNNVNQILNLVRVTRSEEKSISFTLGVPFKQIMLEWQEYYTNMSNQVSKSYNTPDETKSLVSLKLEEHLSSISLSPDATLLAYAINENSKYQVFIKNIATGKVDKVISYGHRVTDQEVDHTIPLLDWQNDHTLGVVAYKKGGYYLWLYDTETDSKVASPLRNLEKVNAINFSGNGRLAVLSANRTGKTDIYLLSVRRNKIRRLTNDYFDDVNPTFIPNSNTIIFSSNRSNDTLKVDEESFKKLSTNFNIFTFNLDTTKTVLSRLTNTISYDFAPKAKTESDFYYLSDQKGITNLFKYSLIDSLYLQVTAFSKNIRNYDVNFDNNVFVYVALNGQKEQVFLDPNFDFSYSSFTPLTPRQQIQQVNFLSAKRLEAAKKRNSKPLVPQKEQPEKTLKKEEIDSVKTETKDKPDRKEETDDTGLIDTDNYVFDKEVVKKKKKTGSFLSNYKRISHSTKVKGPFEYKPIVSADNITTSWVIDPIRRFGVLLEAQMNDMLGNHKFLSGAMISTDFKSGDVYVEYQYLKNLVDYSARFDRSSWFIDEGGELRQKYAKSKIEVAASLPFTAKTRLALKPSYTYTRFQDLNPALLASNVAIPENIGNSYVGITAEFVYDNSIVFGQNMIEGTRFKLSFQHNESLNDQSRSFANFNFDLRHYQKLYRSLVFASRVYYGSFFGKYKHSYLLGGMDNWLFQNAPAQADPWLPRPSVENQSLYFLQYATSLRGYDYNTFNGSNVLMANFELRMPIASIFYAGPVSSSFVKNFQLVAFFDIGSSWTGISPFSEDNQISTVIIKDSNFEAQIQTFKNPWLMGYGIGMRSVIFGYFMKFDLAFPYEDNEVGDSKFYVTLGHDF